VAGSSSRLAARVTLSTPKTRSPASILLQSAVGVVDVDLASAQPRGNAAQLAGPVRDPHNSDLRLLEDHAQAAQHRAGAGHIVYQEPGQALALLDIGLKGQMLTPRSARATSTSPARPACPQWLP